MAFHFNINNIFVFYYRNKDSSCEILPNSLQAKCVQKYLLRKLYALQEDGTKKEIREVKFKIPSCCMCMVFNARRRRRHNLRLSSNRRENRNARKLVFYSYLCDL